MQSVLARLLQPTWVLVGLVVIIALLVVAALALWTGAVHDTEQLVGPFRWEPAPHSG